MSSFTFVFIHDLIFFIKKYRDWNKLCKVDFRKTFADNYFVVRYSKKRFSEMT